MFETVDFAVEDGIATVTLNRPHVVNALDVRMRDDLWQIFGAVADDPEVRGMLLRGAGERGFCAGADLAEFGSAPSQAIAREVRWERDLWGLLLAMPKPTVAAVHGHCIGSGVEMACLCDLRVVADDAQFRMPEAHLGMIPAAGGTQTLPRMVGRGRALEWLLSGRTLSAAEAARAGLATMVVRRPGLEPASRRLLSRLAAMPEAASRLAKRAINEGADLPLPQALDLEARLAAGLLTQARG
ncbi:MAG: enoyl-CoA hydratase/isomerase family protein [SAR202 cluster bacterium]|nr:enoyl-CoA hydratase/isomerase family protein [SAR202 cluster bacterium]